MSSGLGAAHSEALMGNLSVSIGEIDKFGYYTFEVGGIWNQNNVRSGGISIFVSSVSA
jgi:hypothetical protein